jgi:prolyl 4-hydroxylase
MYNHMEHYSAHHDFFDPAAYASNPEMLASVEHGAKNRLATVFFYLNNVTDLPDVSHGGGQTNFPRAVTAEWPNGGPQPRDYFDCSKGLSVYPQGGKVRLRPTPHPSHLVFPSRFSSPLISSPLTSSPLSSPLLISPPLLSSPLLSSQVIIFYSMQPDGTMDDFSLHGGCDVLEKTATKWSANFWLWNKPYHFMDGARRKTTQRLMDSWL